MFVGTLAREGMGGGNRERDDACTLRAEVSLEQARQQLSERIAAGREMAADVRRRQHAGSADDDLSALVRAGEQWNEHNRALLQRWFTTSEVVVEYLGRRPDRHGRLLRSPAEPYRTLLAELDLRLAFLEDLSERLDVYRPAADDRPAGDRSTSYTVYGNVGQIVSDSTAHIERSVISVGADDRMQVEVALEKLVQAIDGAPEMDVKQRAAAKEVIEDLQEQARLPAEQRRTGRISAGLDAIRKLAEVGSSVATAVADWLPIVSDALS